MASLIDETPQADVWLDSMRKALSPKSPYGRIVDAVLWTSTLTDQGVPLVEVEPNELVEEINSKGIPLLLNHDPGEPRGMVLCASQFTSPTGTTFIAGLLGLYEQADCLSFEAIGLDELPPVGPPSILSPLPQEAYISFAVDPREVDETWVVEVLSEAPIPVRRKELSHNASDASTELIRLALPYVLLVWNPFVTEIAKEGGKDAYAGVRDWLARIIAKLTALKNPILVMESSQDGCHVLFLLRGSSIGQHYAAHEKISDAATQAAQLIAHLKERKLMPKQVVYEFTPADQRWSPSSATLADGRLITSHAALIAIEQAPVGLSLGLTRNSPE